MRIAEGFVERLMGRRTTAPVAGTIEMVYLAMVNNKDSPIAAVVVICSHENGDLSTHYINGVRLEPLQ